MSLKLGTQDIAGISQNTKYNTHHLLDFKWTDCIMNDVSWLRADTFSWQSGDVYTSAYNHLVQDIQGITPVTETIGSYTVTFYRATDGHKICLADQEQTVLNIYNTYGIAWYYILDTTNTQFKLPRTKYGFEGLRTNVGDYIQAGLPNITGRWNTVSGFEGNIASYTGAITDSGSTLYNASNIAGSYNYKRGIVNFNASLSSTVYGNSDTVQERATQMYLYFYVGDYSQTAIEQTAGLNSELFNGKADVDLSNCTKPHIVETYVNGTSWYRVYSDGWCEQGGTLQANVSFLQEFSNTDYTISLAQSGSGASATVGRSTWLVKSTSGFTANLSTPTDWQACGYIN